MLSPRSRIFGLKPHGPSREDEPSPRHNRAVAASRELHELCTVEIEKGKPVTRLVEIKGLAGQVKAAKDALAQIRTASADLNASAAAFAAEIADVKAQIEEARSDLKFEAQTLGNSASNSAG